MARNLGDVLSKVRDRRNSLVIESNGKPVARIVPIAGAAGNVTVAEALTVWTSGAAADRTFVDDLAAVDAFDRSPVNRWSLSPPSAGGAARCADR